MSIKAMALLLVALPLTACATGYASQEEWKLTEGPVVREVSSPYNSALVCVSKVRGVKHLRVAVGDVIDRTGKLNAAEGGTGAFVSQGAGDMLRTALSKTGVQLIEIGPGYRAVVDWYAAKQGARLAGDGTMHTVNFASAEGKPEAKSVPYIPPQPGTIGTPKLLIQGAVTSLDFMPGGGVELSVSGIGPKARQHRVLVRLDLQAVTMPYPGQVGGTTVATIALEKQVVAVETEFGVAGFFGGGGDTTYVRFRIGKQDREALQYVLGRMLEYASVELLAKIQKRPGACRDALEGVGETHVASTK